MNKFAVSGAGGTERLAAVGPVPPQRQGGQGPRAAGLAEAEGARREGAVAAARGRLHRNGLLGQVDAAFVVQRLEEAGATLLALPSHGYSTAMRTTKLDIVRVAMEAYGHDRARLRPPMPDSPRISRMDEALGWITLIPLDSYTLRRIVGARALVSPMTQRHLYSWRRLAEAMGADHKAVQRWHAQGIACVVRALADMPG